MPGAKECHHAGDAKQGARARRKGCAGGEALVVVVCLQSRVRRLLKRAVTAAMQNIASSQHASLDLVVANVKVNPRAKQARHAQRQVELYDGP